MSFLDLLPNQPDAPPDGECEGCGTSVYRVNIRARERELSFLPRFCQECSDKFEERTGNAGTTNQELEDLGIRPVYYQCTLEEFEKIVEINNEQGFRYASAFVERYDKLFGKGLYIYGNVGTGKTALAVGVLRRIGDGFLINAAELLDELSQRNPEIMKKVTRTPLLVLDDLGAEQMTTNNTNMFVANRLYRIINERYERMMPTIITTNIRPSSLRGIMGERVASRVLSMCVPALVDGQDRRRKY